MARHNDFHGVKCFSNSVAELTFTSETRLFRFTLMLWESIRCSIYVDSVGIACEHLRQTRSSKIGDVSSLKKDCAVLL